MPTRKKASHRLALFHVKKRCTYFTASIRYATADLISASEAVEPPLGGIAPLPLMALAVNPSSPATKRGAQAALSPNLGAPATPATWHTEQACLYNASPAPAATVVAPAAGAAAATATAVSAAPAAAAGSAAAAGAAAGVASAAGVVAPAATPAAAARQTWHHPHWPCTPQRGRFLCR
jgi:hypothetical protein